MRRVIVVVDAERVPGSIKEGVESALYTPRFMRPGTALDWYVSLFVSGFLGTLAMLRIFGLA